MKSTENTADVSRTAILLSKLMQSVAAGTPLDSSNILFKFNDFIVYYSEKLKQFTYGLAVSDLGLFLTTFPYLVIVLGGYLLRHATLADEQIKLILPNYLEHSRNSYDGRDVSQDRTGCGEEIIPNHSQLHSPI
jgi:hypothetical protein